MPTPGFGWGRMFEDRGVMSRGWVSDATVFDDAAAGNRGRVRSEAAKDDQAGNTLATGQLVPMMGAVAVDPRGGTVCVAVPGDTGPFGDDPRTFDAGTSLLVMAGGRATTPTATAPGRSRSGSW